MIVETNYPEVVNLWNSGCNSRAVVTPILIDIGELASSFEFISFQHVTMFSFLRGILLHIVVATHHSIIR